MVSFHFPMREWGMSIWKGQSDNGNYRGNLGEIKYSTATFTFQEK